MKPASGVDAAPLVGRRAESLAIARQVLVTEAAALTKLAAEFDEEALSAALTMLLKCPGRIVCTGMGKSGIIGKKLAGTLASTGTPAFFLHPAEAGHGDNFGHSLGHGVGLFIHEYPRVGPKSESPLEVGMVFTVEPGIYLSGWGGVRIEDVVLLREDGAAVLSKAKK